MAAPFLTAVTIRNSTAASLHAQRIEHGVYVGIGAAVEGKLIALETLPALAGRKGRLDHAKAPVAAAAEEPFARILRVVAVRIVAVADVVAATCAVGCETFAPGPARRRLLLSLITFEAARQRKYR